MLALHPVTRMLLGIGGALIAVAMIDPLDSAFAQEAPTDWYGTFNWNHNCEGPATDKFHGIGDLALDYDGQGNLTGTLEGILERVQIIPEYTITFLADGTFSAKLTGSYTPGPESFSAQVVDVETTPGQASFTGPAGSYVGEVPFYTVYEAPVFPAAFRDLRRQPDGSLKSNGESVVSGGDMTCTTTYSLTLRSAQN